MFKFSAALLQKESEAFSIIFQKSFRTEMEHISNGKIKVILFHPRTHKVKEMNYFILGVFWSWFLIYSEFDFFIKMHEKDSLIHNSVIFAYCSWTRMIFTALFSSSFSASQESLISEHQYRWLLSPNRFSSGSY